MLRFFSYENKKMDLQFLKIIKNNIRLSNYQRVVIAFSGGIDSVCLVDLFRKLENRLIIAHFNHGIRENAQRDESFAKEFSEKLGLEFVSGRADVPLFAKENRLSLEEAARKKRNEFLFQIARDKGAKLIAVGHHADDQVETMLMHLLRGSGLTGLAGMKEITVIPEFDNEIKIIRPLLSFKRSEIEEYCAINNLEFVVDETNASDLYERNQIRHEIIPYLNERYPGLNQRLLNLTSILQYEDEIIQDLTTSVWDQICLEKHSQFIRINKTELAKLPLGIQRRMIRQIVFSLKPEIRDLSFKNIEDVLNFMTSEKNGEIDLQENLIALFNHQEIIFGCKSKSWIDFLYPQLKQPVQLILDRDYFIEISENWLFRSEILTSFNPGMKKIEDPFSAFLDAERIGRNIRLRVKQDGERFQPLGVEKGSLKLSDIFINEKIFQPARERWPLVTNSDCEIIWIPGFRAHHDYRITDSTKKIIKFSVEKIC